MFFTHVNGKIVRDDRGRPACPTLSDRIEMLASFVAADLDELGCYDPSGTPTSYVSESTDSAVVNLFPGMCNLAGNPRYVRLVVNCVGKRAFEIIDTF